MYNSQSRKTHGTQNPPPMHTLSSVEYTVRGSGGDGACSYSECECWPRHCACVQCNTLTSYFSLFLSLTCSLSLRALVRWLRFFLWKKKKKKRIGTLYIHFPTLHLIPINARRFLYTIVNSFAFHPSSEATVKTVRFIILPSVEEEEEKQQKKKRQKQNIHVHTNTLLHTHSLTLTHTHTKTLIKHLENKTTIEKEQFKKLKRWIPKISLSRASAMATSVLLTRKAIGFF